MQDHFACQLAVNLNLCHKEIVKFFSFLLDLQDNRILLWDTRCPKPATRIGTSLCASLLLHEFVLEGINSFMPDLCLESSDVPVKS